MFISATFTERVTDTCADYLDWRQQPSGVAVVLIETWGDLLLQMFFLCYEAVTGFEVSAVHNCSCCKTDHSNIHTIPQIYRCTNCFGYSQGWCTFSETLDTVGRFKFQWEFFSAQQYVELHPEQLPIDAERIQTMHAMINCWTNLFTKQRCKK